MCVELYSFPQKLKHIVSCRCKPFSQLHYGIVSYSNKVRVHIRNRT